MNEQTYLSKNSSHREWLNYKVRLDISKKLDKLIKLNTKEEVKPKPKPTKKTTSKKEK